MNIHIYIHIYTYIVQYSDILYYVLMSWFYNLVTTYKWHKCNTTMLLLEAKMQLSEG